MILAIPVVEGKLSPHFGHCESFAFVTVDPDAGRVVSCRMSEPPPHEPGVLPAWLAREGAHLIIAGGMGARAQGLFASQDIEVMVGAPVETPERIAQAYLAGTLETGANLCDH